jgi:cell wall-associated NlpC family hydrolase
LSFRTNLSYTALLASARERAGEITNQALSLRGRAAAGAVGAATLGVLTLGSAAGAMAASGPSEVTTTPTVAGQAIGAGKAGNGAALSPDQVTEKGEKVAEKGEKSAVKAAPREFAGKKANSAESSTSKGATAEDVIKLAEKQIGIKEGKGGNTKFHKWYINSDYGKRTAERDGGKVTDYKGAAWCDMFVSWIGEKTGAKGMGTDAYTVSHAKWFKDHDRWGKKARPGAVVFFAWDGSKSIGAIEHVGFVVKDNGNGTITTVEGNTGNSVDKKIRPKSEVAGYGYPEYRK